MRDALENGSAVELGAALEYGGAFGCRDAPIVRSALILILSGVAAMALMVFALWMWQGSADWASDFQPRRPEIIAWALRCLALGAAALAQFLIARLLAARIYRHGLFDDALCLASAVTCAIALVGAAALALAGR